MRRGLAGAAVLAVLALAPAAQAAQRYAAPGGTGAACSRAAPCSLSEAISNAASDDEVIVAAGDYPVPSEITGSPAASNVYVHGDFSAPMPRIHASLVNGPIYLSGPGDRLSNLEIVNEHEGAWSAACAAPGGSVERLRVVALGKLVRGITQNPGCGVRDSLIQAAGEGAVALFTGTLVGEATTLTRNVTAIASGPESIGVVAEFIGIIPGGGRLDLDLENSIASGGGSDLVATGFNGTARIVATNSNFDAAKPSGEAEITGSSNQTAPPLFVDAANGDYREAPGSPTIDAGVPDPEIGATDLEGNPRSLGAAPDIGAYELVPQPPAAPPAGVIESLSLKPREFRAADAGSALISGRGRRRAVGTTVSYTLSAAGSVGFSVERRISGRRVGGRCVGETASNRGPGDHRRCALFRRRRGGFTIGGAAGRNSFRLSGRLDGRTLKPGSYRLVGRAGDSLKRAAFRIVP